MFQKDFGLRDTYVERLALWPSASAGEIPISVLCGNFEMPPSPQRHLIPIDGPSLITQDRSRKQSTTSSNSAGNAQHSQAYKKATSDHIDNKTKRLIAEPIGER